MKQPQEKIDDLREKIDYAIDAWLQAQGFTDVQIGDMNFSFIDDELNSLVTMNESEE